VVMISECIVKPEAFRVYCIRDANNFGKANATAGSMNRQQF